MYGLSRMTRRMVTSVTWNESAHHRIGVMSRKIIFHDLTDFRHLYMGKLALGEDRPAFRVSRPVVPRMITARRIRQQPVPGGGARDHRAPRQRLRRQRRAADRARRARSDRPGWSRYRLLVRHRIGGRCKLVSEVVQLIGCWRTKRRTMSHALTCMPRSFGTSVSPCKHGQTTSTTFAKGGEDLRAPDYESGGQRFESFRARHEIKYLASHPEFQRASG